MLWGNKFWNQDRKIPQKTNTEKKTKNFEVTAKQRKVAIFCYRAIFNYLAAQGVQVDRN